MINTHLTIHGIRIHVIGDQSQRVAMHEQAVTLRIVDGYSALRGKGISRCLVIKTIIAG